MPWVDLESEIAEEFEEQQRPQHEKIEQGLEGRAARYFEMVRKWEKAGRAKRYGDPDRYKRHLEYVRDWKRRKSGFKPAEKCVECGAPFENPRGQKKFCDKKCSLRNFRRRGKANGTKQEGDGSGRAE